ncbi:MAG: hypothetical protein JRF60_15370 [Deltaproteobacteria bacterium]|nr:hypothetical protein [Deltaproteobacteria bacterium]
MLKSPAHRPVKEWGQVLMLASNVEFSVGHSCGSVLFSAMFILSILAVFTLPWVAYPQTNMNK